MLLLTNHILSKPEVSTFRLLLLSLSTYCLSSALSAFTSFTLDQEPGKEVGVCHGDRASGLPQAFLFHLNLLESPGTGREGGVSLADRDEGTGPNNPGDLSAPVSLTHSFKEAPP